MNDSGKFIIGALSGVAIGLAIGVLMAPAAGEETRDKIKSKFGDASEDLANLVNKSKERASEVVDHAKEAFGASRKEVEEKGKDAMNRTKSSV